MNIAIVGGGFTGLTVAYKLSKDKTKHKITLFEKSKELGGLASVFKLPNWNWWLEKHYHHWFTNDTHIINLLAELDIQNKLYFPKALTSIYYKGSIYPFNSPSHLISFTPISFTNRVRTGMATLFLKLFPRAFYPMLEKYTAYKMAEKLFGKSSFKTIWKPLLEGKFGQYADSVNMAWLWARIKKRTLKLGYLEGGFKTLIDSLAQQIRYKNVTIKLNYNFKRNDIADFDKVVFTTPSSVFYSIFPSLENKYKEKLVKIPHLHALNLLLVCKNKFLKKTYWLNINDHSFPFIGVIQHTNFINTSHYGGNHLVYVANYLPHKHPYLQMNKEELFKTYLPYLKKINPKFNSQLSILNSQLFVGPFAQPVFPTNYSKKLPSMTTPIANVYLANMDMIYPWDRGTNYAVELGYKVAEVVEQEN